MCPIDDPSRDPGLHPFESVKLPCNDLDCYPSQHVHSSCIPSVSTRAYPIVDPSVYPSLTLTFVSRSDSRFIHGYYNNLLPSLHSCLFTSNNHDSLSDDSCTVFYIGSTPNQNFEGLFSHQMNYSPLFFYQV